MHTASHHSLSPCAFVYSGSRSVTSLSHPASTLLLVKICFGRRLNLYFDPLTPPTNNNNNKTPHLQKFLWKLQLNLVKVVYRLMLLAEFSRLHFELNSVVTLWDSGDQNRLSRSQTSSSPPLNNQRLVTGGRKLTAEQQEKHEATSTSERMSRLNNSKKYILKKKQKKQKNRNNRSFLRVSDGQVRRRSLLRECSLCCIGPHSNYLTCISAEQQPCTTPM